MKQLVEYCGPATCRFCAARAVAMYFEQRPAVPDPVLGEGWTESRGTGMFLCATHAREAITAFGHAHLRAFEGAN